MATMTPTTESEILHHLVFPFDQGLDPQAPRSLLRIRFDRQATKQINQLLRKNQRGTISAEERRESWSSIFGWANSSMFFRQKPGRP